MAVIFGKAGTTRVTRGAKLICTPEQLIASPSLPPVQFEPGDFGFNDGVVGYTTNTITFSKSGRLYISAIPLYGTISAYGYKNANQMYSFASQLEATTYPNDNGTYGGIYFGYITFYGVYDVSVNDTMYFTTQQEEFSPFGDTLVVEFRINSFTGTLIDSFTVSYS